MGLPSRSRSHTSEPSRADSPQKLIAALQHDVRVLASDIGKRNTGRYGNLDRAATFIEDAVHSGGRTGMSSDLYGDGEKPPICRVVECV
jgi:hypothetical protein